MDLNRSHGRSGNLATVNSKRGILCASRIERWSHIVESHDYMAGHLDLVVETLADPDYVVAGVRGELLALKRYDHTAIGPKHMVVAYREHERDGFVVTAFITSKADKLGKRGLQWRMLKEVISMVPQTLNRRAKHLWLDYDEEADVLYFSVRNARATDSDMEGRFIYHYDGSELVGVTVLQAKASAGASAE